MTNSVNSISTDSVRSILSEINLGSSSSVQLMFAKLQLANSQLCKMNAENYLDEITKTQEKQTEIADMIEKARALQNEAETKNTTTTMPDEMVQFFKDNGLAIDQHGNGDNLHYADEWEFNIQSLTNFQKKFESSTQTQMVYLQDFISQMNSYLQGANSAIQDQSQVLSSILTGR